jgi:hypothetical protein
MPSHIVEYFRGLRHSMNEGTSTEHQRQHATTPGIVVLSTSFELLHMNQRALALLTPLNGTVHETAQSIGAKRTVAAPLHQHGQDIIQTMQVRLAANNWEPFHQYSLIGDSSGQILIKGFGLPDRRGAAHSRIVMLLSPHTPAPISGRGDRVMARAGGETLIDRLPDTIAPLLPGEDPRQPLP